jgi:YD repeat-containing protein
MKLNGFRYLTATLVVSIVINLACATASHAQLVGCETTGSGSCISSMPGPMPGEQFTDLSSGIFTYSKTDMTLPGPMPINIARVYRSSDKHNTIWNSRAFGLGTSLNYDIFLYSFSEIANGQFTDAEVVLPDGGMIKCIRSDAFPVTDYVDAEFACNQQPTGEWFGSTITYNSGNSGWDLKRLDGTTYHFGYNSPLQTITDRYGNQISIVRGGPKASICSNSVPANSISTISSSNGRSVSFCYDNSNYPTGISKITDNSPSVGKLVTYTYGTNNQLQTVTQTSYNSKATTTYAYNQGSPAAGIGNITQITVNDACSGTNCSSPLQFSTYITYAANALGNAVQSVSSTSVPGDGYQYSYTIPSGWTSAQKVKVTLPDASKRTFIYDSAGYVINDQRNVGVNGTNAEYTVFTRNTQTIGTVGNAIGTTEFVGQVQEQDQNQNTVRQTNYNYDNDGNVLSMTVSPKPGLPDNVSTDCCSTSAIWNYTYTTFNRLKTSVEPLAYNGTGTTYSYDDTPSAPKMTVTDPLGRATTTTDNLQGQPIRVLNASGDTSSATYSSSGDILTSTDGTGKTTTYQPDADGRIISVTSPLNEVTTYKYDTLDSVTDMYVDPAGFNLHTNYTYDLVGEIATITTPNNNKTTYTRTANLTKTTVTDPRGKTTVTNIDKLGGFTDYTDKRGITTTYQYDQFGRISQADFNSNGVSGYPNFDVLVGYSPNNGAYDALDRPEHISYLANGNANYYGPNFTYDSLDNVLSEGGLDPSGTVNTNLVYQYDSNGRRIQLTPTLNSTVQPVINYGYDCADELVSMSNNGSSLQSCSPSIDVTNGDPSTQVDFYYTPGGELWFTIVDGLTTLLTRDQDERVTQQVFSSYQSGLDYGGLDYTYDADGRVIDKGNTLAAVSLPPSDTASYSPTDQLSLWNGAPTSPDPASNITSDPVLGLSYTWDARNDLTKISGGVTEEFDTLGRRAMSTSGTHSLSLIHDGSSVIGSFDGISRNTWTFLPGGLAGSLTSGGNTATWVPLLDLDGSTIALVNATQTQPPAATTFTYDPSGVSTVTGLSNSFPFLYQGLEHEVSDPGQLYFEPSGNVYNPQIQRELSQAGQQGSGDPPSGGGGAGGGGYGGFGNFGHAPGSQAGESLQQTFSNLRTVFAAASLASPSGWFGFSFSGFGPEGSGFFSGSLPIPFLSSLFPGGGGGDDQPPPVRKRNPPWLFAAVASDLTPNQESAGNPGRPLTPCEKDCLKPYIDQVDLNNARLHTNGLPWYTTLARVDGTTPPGGHDIFIRAGKYDGSPEALALLGHELKHVEQWRKDPTVGIWGYLFHVNKYEGPANILQQQIGLEFSKEHFGGCK